MLRIQSRDAPEPPPANEAALADMAQVVTDAQAEIARLVQLGELRNDPIRYPIQALSVHLDALYRITHASSQVLAHQIHAAAQPVDWRNQPSAQDERPGALARGATGPANTTAQALNWRSAAVYSGLVICALLIGAAAGYAVHGDRQPIAGVSAGPTECQDVNGGTLCRIPIWAKPPPGQPTR